MDSKDVKTGLRIRTIKKLESAAGMMVMTRYLRDRAADAEGYVMNQIPGHSGACWFVDHGGDRFGAYAFTELESVAE